MAAKDSQKLFIDKTVFIDRLDLSDPVVVSDYERRFYQSFIKLEKQSLIRKLWNFDDEQQRLKAKIPYQEQIVFNLNDGDGVFGAIGLNMGKKLFQFSDYGFQLPSTSTDICRACEVLTMFSVKHRVNQERWLGICKEVFRYGFTDIFATTAPRPLPLYQRLGFQVIDKAVIDGEARYFIRMSNDIA